MIVIRATCEMRARSGQEADMRAMRARCEPEADMIGIGADMPA